MNGLALAGALLPAACALLTVLLLAVLVKDDEEVDARLHRSFMVIFSVLMVAAFGFIREPKVQQALDSVQRRQAELAAHPVFLALEETHIDQPPAEKGVRKALAAQLADERHSIPAAMSFVRPELERVGNDRLGFAGIQQRIAWGRMHLATLKELAAVDPLACHGMIYGTARGDAALRDSVSADNDRDFQQVLVAMLRDGYANMGRHTSLPESERVDFNDMARRFGVLREQWVARFGEDIVGSLPKTGRGETDPRGKEAAFCTARISQLTDVLAEPPPMAAGFVDSLLR